MANQRSNRGPGGGNDQPFDPFSLQPEGSDDKQQQRARPVLIAVSEGGNSDEITPNGIGRPVGGPIHPDDSFDPFDIAGLQQQQQSSASAAAAGLRGGSAVQQTQQLEPPRHAPAPQPPPPPHRQMLQPPPQVSRVTRSAASSTTSSPSASAAGTAASTTGASPAPLSALPPKLMVKLTLHEEVSSVQKMGTNSEGEPYPEGTSDISVEGSIYAQVQCSDARKNAPFCLQQRLLQQERLTMTGLHVRSNPAFTMEQQQQQSSSSDPCRTDSDPESRKTTTPLLKIPKHEIGFVPVAYYSLADIVEHMPILVERKVTIHEKSCRIAVQIRSKLTNLGDLHDFTICVAIPERVNGASLEIVRGEGEWDELQRTVKWKLDSLNRGESLMVSAQAELWTELQAEEEISFPVLLRCSSSVDQISSVDFVAVPADGHPSSITFQKTHSFRLLHRLT